MARIIPGEEDEGQQITTKRGKKKGAREIPDEEPHKAKTQKAKRMSHQAWMVVLRMEARRPRTRKAKSGLTSRALKRGGTMFLNKLR